MKNHLPGFESRRLIALIKDAIRRCRLDLSHKVVVTEAASGAYAATPIIAALAGAKKVIAVAKSSRYGSAREVKRTVLRLAKEARIESRIRIYSGKEARHFRDADIVTNSGHLRPLDARTLSWMKPGAVIPLMYEAWEFRKADVDLKACRKRGVPVAGTNERDPRIGVFGYLGAMAVKLLQDAGLPVHENRVFLLCDNSFGPYLRKGLEGTGALVDSGRVLPAKFKRNYDAILLARTPGPSPFFNSAEVKRLVRSGGRPIIVQFYGDPDRKRLKKAGLACWPIEAPAAHHMGILPSAVGPDAIVRLQTGGLKVGELLLKKNAGKKNIPDFSLCQPI